MSLFPLRGILVGGVFSASLMTSPFSEHSVVSLQSAVCFKYNFYHAKYVTNTANFTNVYLVNLLKNVKLQFTHSSLPTYANRCSFYFASFSSMRTGIGLLAETVWTLHTFKYMFLFLIYIFLEVLRSKIVVLIVSS